MRENTCTPLPCIPLRQLLSTPAPGIPLAPLPGSLSSSSAAAFFARTAGYPKTRIEKQWVKAQVRRARGRGAVGGVKQRVPPARVAARDARLLHSHTPCVIKRTARRRTDGVMGKKKDSQHRERERERERMSSKTRPSAKKKKKSKRKRKRRGKKTKRTKNWQVGIAAFTHTHTHTQELSPLLTPPHCAVPSLLLLPVPPPPGAKECGRGCARVCGMARENVELCCCCRCCCCCDPAQPAPRQCYSPSSCSPSSLLSLVLSLSACCALELTLSCCAPLLLLFLLCLSVCLSVSVAFFHHTPKEYWVREMTEEGLPEAASAGAGLAGSERENRIDRNSRCLSHLSLPCPTLPCQPPGVPLSTQSRSPNKA